jgi:transcriptional regulator with XRE-family HTH domain
LQEYSLAGVDARSDTAENQGMTTIKAALGRAIGEIRAESKISQEQLAEKVGIGQPTLSKIERGKQDIASEALGGIAAALGVKVSEIWARAEFAWDKPAQGKRLTVAGSAEPASKALQGYRGLNDIMAVQWSLGALVGHLAASRPSEAGRLVAALERIPEAYQSTGPGAALLNQLEALRAAVAKQEAAKRAAKRRGK